MVWIPRGKFTMGTEDKNPRFFDARPEHEVYIDGFWMDETEVTNAQFARFVEATGYITVAEKKPTLEEIMPDLRPGQKPPDPEKLVAGSMVFQPPAKRAIRIRREWNEVGSRGLLEIPEGPGSDIQDRMNHPVVHVC